MRERRTFAGLPVVGMATAGLLVGHWLAYVVAVPAWQARMAVLTGTGHGYWHTAVRTAVALVLAALVTVVVRVARRRHSGSDAEDTFASVALRLAVVQVVAFAGMEAFERLISGVPVGGLLGSTSFLVGLALQVWLAAAGALVLVWFGRTAVRIVDALRARDRVLRPATSRPPRLASPFRPPAALAGAAGVRGPPR